MLQQVQKRHVTMAQIWNENLKNFPDKMPPKNPNMPDPQLPPDDDELGFNWKKLFYVTAITAANGAFIYFVYLYLTVRCFVLNLYKVFLINF